MNELIYNLMFGDREKEDEQLEVAKALALYEQFLEENNKEE